MSGLTLQKAQQILDALIDAQLNAAANEMSSVSVAGRTVTFRSMKELGDEIARWQNIVARLKQAAAGGPRHGASVALFNRHYSRCR